MLTLPILTCWIVIYISIINAVKYLIFDLIVGQKCPNNGTFGTTTFLIIRKLLASIFKNPIFFFSAVWLHTFFNTNRSFVPQKPFSEFFGWFSVRRYVLITFVCNFNLCKTYVYVIFVAYKRSVDSLRN